MKGLLDQDFSAQVNEDLGSRQTLFLEKLKEKTRKFSEVIQVDRDSKRLPLSVAQQQLWHISSFGQGASRSYHESVAVNLRGELDLDAFMKAYTLLLQRHEILNSVIGIDDEGNPYQRMEPLLACEIKMHDFTKIKDRVERRNAFRAFLSDFSEQDFDFQKDRLIRAAAIKMDGKHWSIVLVLHHMVMDGWSMGVLARDLSKLYKAQVTGEPVDLPVLDIQYGDYALWQKRCFDRDSNIESVHFWREQLKDVPNLDIPADRVRPHLPSHKGGWVSFELDSELVEEIRRLSKAARVTQFVTLVSIYKILLFRLTGQTDLCVGTPVANRLRPEVEDLIGLFVNTLALRTEINPEDSLLIVIDKLKKTTAQAFRHQEIPFEKVVSAVKPHRDQSITPIFQTLFVLQNASRSKFELYGVDVEVEYPENIYSKFDVSCYLSESPKRGLDCGIEYATDLFNRDTMEHFAQHFVELCKAAIAAPEKPACELEFLTEKEKHQLLVEWNNTEFSYPSDKCIHELFEAQVHKTPNATAIIFEGEQLTYRELNKKANQLAHYLVERGVKPDTLVGICVERSLEMVISMLGILKSGAAYVPLDSEYPAERLAFMQEDAALNIVLTQTHLQTRLGIDPNKAVCLDAVDTLREVGLLSPDNIMPQQLGLNSSHLAYVIYTSGSTGKPKGVMICHSNTNALYQWASETFTREELSLIVASTSICFDLSIFEILISLQLGARVLIVQNILSLAYSEQLEGVREEISLINTVPSAIKQLLELNAIPSSVRVANLAGEPLKQDLVDALYERGIPKVYDLYGPSEDTTYSTFVLRSAKGIASIGRPIQNTRAYVVSDNMKLMPRGSIGELHLGGAGLAKGYLNRPDLTAEKFVPNPFSEDPSARLYKTGDLCRYLPDGNIQYIGRIDHQVKIRGFRIELGEIESALLEYSGIRDAVVRAKEDSAEGDTFLAAFIVCEEEVETGEIRDHLGQKLPGYMVPSAFKVLSELPLTPNGKIDHKALLSLELNRFGAGSEYVAPVTETEKLLVAIWASVLDLLEDQIGMEHDFFLLGGHSLLATRVVARIRQQLNKELPLRVFFESPTVRVLGLYLDQTKFEIQLPGIERQVGRSRFPLSFAQERLWFLDQLDGRKEAYHVPCVYRLQGPLDHVLLEKAVASLFERHESLRTNIYVNDGQAYQIIHDISQAHLKYCDLTDFSDDKIREECERLSASFINKHFNLTKDCLARFLLIRRGAEDHTFVMVLHHIITDGWSMGILMSELSLLYKAYLEDKPNPLVPLSIQYADYAVWQRQTLQGEKKGKALRYWKQKLQSTALLEFPTDRTRPPVQSYQGSWVSLAIEREVSDSLNALGRREGCTLFMTLLAVFKTLLHRYSQQEEICVGTPIANRLQPEVESLVGFFVNTLALKSVVGDKHSFRELLQVVKETTLEAYEYQTLPFEQVVEAVQPERSQSYAPIFQVMFVLQNMRTSGVDLPGLRVVQEGASGWTVSKFDFTLSLEEKQNGSIVGGIEYATDLFERGTIEHLARHFVELCKAVIATPEQPICDLEFLTEKERHQLLVEWNDTDAPYPDDKCIQELFEEQVERTPEAAAVIFEEKQLSYRELNEQANQLAHYLVERGVKPDTLVGICVERSLEMVIGMLGILKAGGAYVPLDPEYPAERLAFMQEDAAMEIVLTQVELGGQANIDANKAVLLDDPVTKGKMSGYPVNNIATKELGLNTGHLAYVIYTSGSTGQPKGVMLPHKGPLNTYQWYAKNILINKLERVLLVSSLSFDLTQKNILATLMYGHTLVVPKMLHFDPVLVSNIARKNKITTVNCAPSVWKAIESFTDSGELESLKHLVLGGESLDKFNSTLFFSNHPNSRLINSYGPTECSDVTTFHVVTVNSQVGTNIPIGSGLPNVSHCILDSNNQLVPIGCIGELHIGGLILARGYLNRPDLTAEKFIQNPFSEDPDDRLYKTGDLCRYLPDGNIQYIGRIDHQVKIRGFRIELGEIESVLLGHSAIRDVAVLAKEDLAGDGTYLVAFIVCEGEVETGEVRDYLRQGLPGYMVPSAFKVLAELPLTPNGKVDRKALLSLKLDQFESGMEYVAPATETEKSLVKAWASVLGLPENQIGIEHDFFLLGGHSLLATQVVVRIRQQLNKDLPLRVFFESPTVRALGKRLDKMKSAIQLPRIERQAERSHIPLSFAQERLWFLDQLENTKDSYHVPNIFRLKGDLNVAVLKASFEALMDRHEILRSNICLDNEGRPFQKIRCENTCNIESYSLEEIMGIAHKTEKYQSLIAELISRPFDLAEDILMRVAIIKYKEEEYHLVLVLHHIVTDGLSSEILTRELSTLYIAYSKNEAPLLNDLPIQYADYAAWQRETFQGALLEKEEKYWKHKLNNVVKLEMPTDKSRPPIQSYRGALHSFVIARDLSNSLRDLGRNYGCTLFMTLLSLFKALLNRYTQQSDICIGTPIANRLQSDVEPLIGFFVNTLAIRTEVDNKKSFIELLRNIRETTLSAYDHQSMPFEQVVELVQPERSQSYSPLFQVMFILQNNEGHGLTLPEIKVEQEGVSGWSISKFDLTLSVQEMADGSITGGIEYATDLFEASTIERFGQHFVELLKSIVSNPDVALYEQEFLTTREKHQLLVVWNDTAVPYPEGKCIHELFEDQVEKTPSATAVIFEEQELTYRELNGKANQLAHHLVRQGVKPDSLVGICVERSLEMVIGLLGILKAGGAYVPLDPEYPRARLEHMQEDAQLGIILTQRVILASGLIKESVGICLDDNKVQEKLSTYPEENIEKKYLGLKSDHLAYVIYTSGSTGKAKGVMIEHKGLVNLYQWYAQEILSQHIERVLLLSSLSFDLTQKNIFATLVFGHILVVPNMQYFDPDLVLSCAKKNKVTTINCAPSVWRGIYHHDQSGQLPHLKQLVLGGESLDRFELKQFFADQPDTILCNSYGPTECSDVTSFFKVDRTSADLVTVPIGRGVPNTSHYILDANGKLLPVGVDGELWIGGVGLARGYLNQSDLTAEKFILNPFSNSSEDRLYRTGDLCRYLGDGNIKYIGRIDHQVKIRGLRIELGEIESIILNCGLVRNVIATVRSLDAGDRQLIAHVIPKNENFKDVNIDKFKKSLLQHLKSYLPLYMLPSLLDVRESFPLNSNGKIDRLTLIAEANTGSNKDVEFESLGVVGLRLSEIWKKLTKQKQIGNNDSFFSLGGSSLSMVMLKRQISNCFDIQIKMSDLFQAEEFNQQVQLIENKLTESLKMNAHDMKLKAENMSDQKLQTGVANLIEKYKIPGANVSLYSNEEVYSCSAGINDIDNGSRLNENATFRVSCISKALVTYVAVILSEKGLFDLDTPLQILEPSLFSSWSKFDAVTIRHLLCHTGGFDETAQAALQHGVTNIQEFVGRCDLYEKTFEPGETFVYCPSGLIIVAYLIELRTGLTWLKAMEVYLFEPLGIISEVDNGRGNVANGYVRKLSGEGFCSEPAPTQNEIYEPPQSYRLSLTALDLLKIAIIPINDGMTLDGKRLMSPGMALELVRPHINVENHYFISSWSLGWLGFSSELFGFIANGRGHHTCVAIHSKSKKAVVIQTNSYPNFEFFDEVAKLTVESPLLKPECESSVILSKCVGSYAAQGMKVNVEERGDDYVIGCTYILEDMTWSEPVFGKLVPSGMGDFVVSNKVYPFNGSLSFLNMSISGVPRYVRVTQKICKRV